MKRKKKQKEEEVDKSDALNIDEKDAENMKDYINKEAEKVKKFKDTIEDYRIYPSSFIDDEMKA